MGEKSESKTMIDNNHIAISNRFNDEINDLKEKTDTLYDKLNESNDTIEEIKSKLDDVKLDIYGLTKEKDTAHKEITDIENSIEVIIQDNNKQWITIHTLKEHIAELETKYDNAIKGGYKVFYILLIIDALMIIGHFLIP